MKADLSTFDFTVVTLGECRIPSPYERQKIDVGGSLWRSVLACTGQDKYFCADSSIQS